jgi:hypothetical protein
MLVWRIEIDRQCCPAVFGRQRVVLVGAGPFCWRLNLPILDFSLVPEGHELAGALLLDDRGHAVAARGINELYRAPLPG